MFWSVMTSNNSVYSIPIGNSRRLVITLSLMVMEVNGSSILTTKKICRCFIGRFTEFFDSELPNSTVIGVA